MTVKDEIDLQIEAAEKVNISEVEVNNDVQAVLDAVSSIEDETKCNLLLDAIAFLDLTSLKGGETFEDIKQLCNKGAKPIDVLCENGYPILVAAVCVFPASAQDAIKALTDLNKRLRIKVASVAGDFPAASLPLQQRIDEIKLVVGYGVDEVDVVINRQLALEHKWRDLYEELKLIREVCKGKKLKIILATGDLPTLKDVYMASIVAMLAGCDFIKTSTGKEEVNATLPVGIVMCKAIHDFQKLSKKKIGLKPAGGITTSNDVVQWVTLIDQQLGEDWITKELFRIGASSVLDDLVNSIHALKSK